METLRRRLAILGGNAPWSGGFRAVFCFNSSSPFSSWQSLCGIAATPNRLTVACGSPGTFRQARVSMSSHARSPTTCWQATAPPQWSASQLRDFEPEPFPRAPSAEESALTYDMALQDCEFEQSDLFPAELRDSDRALTSLAGLLQDSGSEQTRVAPSLVRDRKTICLTAFSC